jgi:hypothetical protein
MNNGDSTAPPCSGGGVAEQHTTNDELTDASCCPPIDDGPSPSVSWNVSNINVFPSLFQSQLKNNITITNSPLLG